MIWLALAIGLPFVLWGTLYALAQYGHVNLRPLVAYVRALRWITWAVPPILYVLSMFFDRNPWRHAFYLSLPVSLGIMLVDGWVRRRFAPEKDPSEKSGWWPGRAQ